MKEKFSENSLGLVILIVPLGCSWLFHTINSTEVWQRRKRVFIDFIAFPEMINRHWGCMYFLKIYLLCFFFSNIFTLVGRNLFSLGDALHSNFILLFIVISRTFQN